MRWRGERQSENIEDRRGERGGFGFPFPGGGMRFPSGGGSGGRGLTIMGDGIDPEVVQAAEEKCGDLLEAAMPDDAGQELPAEQKEALLAAAQCMRDRGWKVADPEFDGGRVTQRLDSRSGIDPTDPKFQSDSQECQQEAGVEMPDGERKVG